MDAWGRVARGVAAAWLAAILLPCAHAARPLSSVLRPDVDIYPQFFALVQAPDRTLYVGATDAVLRYDGARWTRVDMPRPGPVRALLVDKRGRVWAGGTDCFGWIERDANGVDRFVDVAPAFDRAYGARDFGDTWGALDHGDEIWFRSLRHLFQVDLDGKPRNHWQNRARFGALGTLDGRVVVQWRGEGLKSWDGERFAMLPGGEAYATPLA